MKSTVAIVVSAALVVALGTFLWLRKYNIVRVGGVVTITNIVVVTTNTVWVYRTNWAELPDLYFRLMPITLVNASNGQSGVFMIPFLTLNKTNL